MHLVLLVRDPVNPLGGRCMLKTMPSHVQIYITYQSSEQPYFRLFGISILTSMFDQQVLSDGKTPELARPPCSLL